MYYGTQLDIRVKSYHRLNLVRASTFHFERLDILRDSIGHPSKKLLSFEFAQSFNIKFRASRCIKGLNQTSEQIIIVVWISSELQNSISIVSIYYGSQSDIRVKSYCRLNLLSASTFNSECLDILRTQSDIRVKSYCRLNLLRASTFNFERLDMLRDSIGHPSNKLLSFEFVQSFGIPFRASRYITGLNQTSE